MTPKTRLVYVVTMQRWGDNETHHYLEGIYIDIKTAKTQGEEESLHRARKYEPHIEKLKINETLRERQKKAEKKYKAKLKKEV